MSRQETGAKRTKGSRSSSRAVRLSGDFHRRLATYAAAAGAAGVGLLATAQPASADIVYTPANSGFSGGRGVFIDINHDGHSDLWLKPFFTSSHTNLFALGYRGASVLRATLGAAALHQGAPIGPGAGQFLSGGLMVSEIFSQSFLFGSWADVANRYLGLRFSFGFGGGIHYGWAELSVSHKGCCAIVARLEGYAYDTVANQVIGAGQIGPNSFLSAPTPEPGTLGLLALGSLGLGFWRRRRAVGNH